LNPDSSIGLSTFGKSPVRDFAKLISQALILLCVYDFISESFTQREGWCIVVYCLSIEVLPSFVGFRFSTSVMARYKKNKPKGKINANTGKVPQEIAKDNSRTLKSVAPEDIQEHRWHQSVRDLPPGQRIDIPYLKELAIKSIVPIAYCIKTDFDIVENFVPAYLLRFTKNIWQLLDEEDIVLSQHNWEDGDDSILNLFGTYMQHPEDEFVVYFGGAPVAALEQGTPKKNPEAFEQGSTRRFPRKNPEALEQGTISRRSPRKNPDQGSPTRSYAQKLAEEINTVAAATEATTTVTGAVASNTTAATTTEINTVAAATAATTTVTGAVASSNTTAATTTEINTVAAATAATTTFTGAVASNTTAATTTVTGAVAAYAATMETMATATTAAVTMAASNNNANPRSNVQAHPRKTNP
jgi:hypothetical protein